MKIERYELEEKLIPKLDELNNTDSKRRVNNKIKKILAENKILEGKVSWILNQPEHVKTEDLRFLCLLTNAIYIADKDPEFNPEEFFTKQEIKESKSFTGVSEFVEKNKLFPLTFKGVLKVDEGVFKVVMNNHLINKLLLNGGLNYNFESQRESKAKKQNNEIIQVATLNENSVKEIAEHLVEGTLVHTDLIFNARLGTSDEGDEVVYDEENNVLMVTEGTIIDTVDGYHRIKGNQTALSINPNINFNFPVTIINATVEEAKRYVGQIGKANPISKSRARELTANNHSALVIKKLRSESMLKGMISQSERLIRLNKEIVTLPVLLNAIEKEFPTKNKMEAMDAGDYLVDFFDNLIGRFQNEFIDKYNEVKKKSLINSNLMFHGYVILARRLKELDKNPKDIVDIIKGIDFSKDNKMWEEIGVMRDGKVNYNKAEKAIKKFFNELEI